jgi:hypothetical protein
VQQCYRVSPGPDFVLVLQVADMPALPRAGAAAVHAGRQRAQREELLQRAPRQVRAAHRLMRPEPRRLTLEDHQPLQVLALRESSCVSGGRRGAQRGRGSKPSTPASMPAPATILWNRSALMPPEQREGEQQAAGRQQHEGQAVDVLVGARGAFGMRCVGANLGGSSTMASKRSPRSSMRAQVWLTSASSAVWRAASKPFSATCAVGTGQRRRRRIDAGHVARAAGQRRDAEAAGVAVAVQHALASRSGAPCRQRACGCRAGRGRSRSCGLRRRRA